MDTNRLKALGFLRERREDGATWSELAEEFDLHHGQASGILSSLHKQDRIARLNQRRERCYVYVDKMYVNDRQTSPYGRARANTYSETEMNKIVDDVLDETMRSIYGMAHVSKPKAVTTHYSGCWRDHVTCALIAAGKQVEARKAF